MEQWRDLPFSRSESYHKINPNMVSKDSYYLSYPISTPLEEDEYIYSNKVMDPRLAMLRNVLRKVELDTNRGIKTILFNVAERPIENKVINAERIKTLSEKIIKLINQFGNPALTVKYISTLNEKHEETEQESRIGFDLKLLLYYPDSTKLGKNDIKQYSIVYIQTEFIFEKKYDLLEEDQFFINQNDKKIDFKVYLSKLIITGSENMGYLGGHHDIKKKNRR